MGQCSAVAVVLDLEAVAGVPRYSIAVMYYVVAVSRNDDGKMTRIRTKRLRFSLYGASISGFQEARSDSVRWPDPSIYFLTAPTRRHRIHSLS